jgi:hypothetical protein
MELHILKSGITRLNQSMNVSGVTVLIEASGKIKLFISHISSEMWL